MSSISSESWTTVEEKKQKKPPKNIKFASPSNCRIKSPIEIEIEKNRQDQQLINNDVIISYTTAPIVANEIKRIVKKFEIDETKIKSTESFVDRKKNFFITISFKDKKTQEELLNASSIYQDFSIRERLTKFNAKVHREVQRLFNIGAINSKRRDDIMFEARIEKESGWLIMSCESALKKLIKDTENTVVARKEEKTEENREKQLKFHNKVLLEGFDIKKFNSKIIVKNFAEIFNLNADDDILSTTSYTKNCQILIELKDKNTHMEVLNQVSSKSIRQSRLIAAHNQNFDPIISITHPLTNFNEKVRTELMRAIKNKKIAKFELYDQCFRFKLSEHSKWIAIKSRDDLKNIP